MSQQRLEGASERQAGTSSEGVTRNILAELTRLPSARAFPPFLGFKRGRADGAVGAGALLLGKSSGKPALSLDPTGILLMEAASQLKDLVEQQACRRMLRASLADGAASVGDGGEDSCSEAGEDEYCQEEPALSADLDTVDSASYPSGPASFNSASYGGEPVRLPSGRTWYGGGSRGGSHSRKRACLERQYALDLDGYCRAIGERLPLPETLETAS